MAETNNDLLFKKHNQIAVLYLSEYVHIARANSITILDRKDFWVLDICSGMFKQKFILLNLNNYTNTINMVSEKKSLCEAKSGNKFIRKFLSNPVSFYSQRPYHIRIGAKLIKCIPALNQT